jgi:aspartate aminotransferase
MTKPSSVSPRIAALQTSLRPLLDFLNESEHAKRIGDPSISDFVFGNPQEMPLEGLVEAIREQAIPANKDWFAYTLKHPAAAEVIARSLREGTGLPFEVPDVCLATGTFGALATAIRATVDAGDEAIFLSPPWFFYESMIAVTGASPVRVSLRGPEFALDHAAIERAITARTRAIIVNSPHNPTGRIYGTGELQALGRVLDAASARHGRPILLFSDESYRRVLFDGRAFTSPATAYDHTIVLYTYGKQLLAPGERVGYLALSPRIADRAELRAAVTFAAIVGGWQFPNATLQRAVPRLEPLSIDVPAIERRRDRLAAELTGLGYSLIVPEATFYMMVRSPMVDDRAFTALLARHDVFVGPGAIFEMPGYFRISLTANDDMVTRAIPGFAAAIREVRGS